MTPSTFEDLRAVNADAGDDDAATVAAMSINARRMAPADDRQMMPAEDRLMTKAQRISDLVQKRNRHFGHVLMADCAMDVMLSLFIAEFAAPSCADAQAVHPRRGDDQHVIAQLLAAGLVAPGEDGALGLTPLGAGRLRSFISAYPEAL